MRIKWITFDLDGTLMQNPFVGWVFPEMENVFKDLCRKNNMETIKISRIIDEHHRRIRLNNLVDAYDWDDIANKILKDYGIDYKMDVGSLVQKHLAEEKVYLLEKGIISTLENLKSKGYNLAAVTNGYFKYQAPVLKYLKIYNQFDAVITPEITGVVKPDIRMAESFADKIIVAHVGDRIDHDVCYANEMNTTSILILRSLPENIRKLHPNYRIEHKETRQLLNNKWNREKQAEDNKLPQKGIPDCIITSIEELEEIY